MAQGNLVQLVELEGFIFMHLLRVSHKPMGQDTLARNGLDKASITKLCTHALLWRLTSLRAFRNYPQLATPDGRAWRRWEGFKMELPGAVGLGRCSEAPVSSGVSHSPKPLASPLAWPLGPLAGLNRFTCDRVPLGML
jgi:hypothetical protein